MNILELKEMIKDYPDDMEILNDRCSDYSVVELGDWSIVLAVPKGCYVMRSHQTMSDENKSKQKRYLHLLGN